MEGRRAAEESRHDSGMGVWVSARVASRAVASATSLPGIPLTHASAPDEVRCHPWPEKNGLDANVWAKTEWVKPYLL